MGGRLYEFPLLRRQVDSAILMPRANQFVSLWCVPIAWVVAALGVSMPLAYFFLAQQREDLDLNSGKLRFQTTLGPLVLSEDVHDSSFSRVIDGPVANSANPHWGRVLVSGFLREHGRYGAALAELERFVTVCDQAQIERATQIDLGRQLLILLRNDRFTEAEALIDGLDTGMKIEADR